MKWDGMGLKRRLTPKLRQEEYAWSLQHHYITVYSISKLMVNIYVKWTAQDGSGQSNTTYPK